MSGTATLYDGMLQMTHPDRVLSEADLDKLPLIEPVYPLTEGLGANQVRKAIDAALGKLPDLTEWQDASLAQAQQIPGLRRRAQDPAPAGRPRRPAAGKPGMVAARL